MVTDMNVNNPSYGHPTPWDAEFDSVTLPEMFARTVRNNPSAPFLHFLGRTYSYRDVFIEAQRFAAGLKVMGIEKGDRVGL